MGTVLAFHSVKASRERGGCSVAPFDEETAIARADRVLVRGRRLTRCVVPADARAFSFVWNAHARLVMRFGVPVVVPRPSNDPLLPWSEQATLKGLDWSRVRDLVSSLYLGGVVVALSVWLLSGAVQ